MCSPVSRGTSPPTTGIRPTIERQTKNPTSALFSTIFAPSHRACGPKMRLAPLSGLSRDHLGLSALVAKNRPPLGDGRRHPDDHHADAHGQRQQERQRGPVLEHLHHVVLVGVHERAEGRDQQYRHLAEPGGDEPLQAQRHREDGRPGTQLLGAGDLPLLAALLDLLGSCLLGLLLAPRHQPGTCSADIASETISSSRPIASGSTANDMPDHQQRQADLGGEHDPDRVQLRGDPGEQGQPQVGEEQHADQRQRDLHRGGEEHPERGA